MNGIIRLAINRIIIVSELLYHILGKIKATLFFCLKFCYNYSQMIHKPMKPIGQNPHFSAGFGTNFRKGIFIAMKPYSFFAMLSRMKYIHRWGLMRNARQENLCEHTLDVTYIAHALALLSGVDPAKAVLCSLYHDCTEIITGDLPTPVKYYDDEIRRSYRRIEDSAGERLLSALPKTLAKEYRPLMLDVDPETRRIVKAADKLSALIKCIEEIRMGNHDFENARQAQLDALEKMDLPAIKIFLTQFLPAYELTLDEMQ